ncbi:MAG: hypothetical protein CL758_04575 [Chloroflexi bacterium]|nr:hypothetical protein [Chloroflexota bacterium]
MNKYSPDSEIRNKISLNSKITFFEFMEIALYHPNGYYNNPNNISSEGDYFTSSVLHPSFAYLLTIQFRQMWKLLDCPKVFWVIEMGAGTGHLANEISKYANIICEDFAKSLRYISLDIYNNFQQYSKKDNTFQHILSNDIPFKDVTGCFISNELVDSFPVHRFKILGKKVYEIYVDIDDEGNLKEVIDEPSSNSIVKRINGFSNHLPDGFEGEVNLKIDDWILSISKSLFKGFLLTIDYGDIRSKLYSENRFNGTLQTYYKHINLNKPLNKVGKQDITSHVDFSSLMEMGDVHGLKTLSYLSQNIYLRKLGFKKMLHKLAQYKLSQYEYYKNRIAMMQLVKSPGLGDFKVLIQEMNTNIDNSDTLFHILEDEINFISPLLNSGYLNFADSKYSHQLDIKNFDSYFI